MLQDNPTKGSGADQQFEEPEAGLVVAGLQGVDEEEQHEAVQHQRVHLHGQQDVVRGRVQAGQDAGAPQHTQETSDLSGRPGGREGDRTGRRKGDCDDYYCT